MVKKILVAGGTGYIGSHTTVELIGAGYEVIIVDNLSNSKAAVVDRIEQITGKRPEFIKADLCDKAAVEKIFSEHEIDAVIHFAGLKIVGESVEKPLEYYDNNINSTLVLVGAMLRHGVNKIVFSSSANVYGTKSVPPVKETDTTGQSISNPYGWTKYMIEQILNDVSRANPDFQVIMLRYFNPIGAHESGLIGEGIDGKPTNVLPNIVKAAIGEIPFVEVYGDDYDTADGTGVRDYIHVVDLANGHVAALDHLSNGLQVFNLGTGTGTTVLELINFYSMACGRKVPYQIKPRRADDIAISYASVSKANNELNWQAMRTVSDACRDSWNWQQKNPNGF